MNQNKYNRKIRLILSNPSTSSSVQRELLTSTQANLSQFQRSKHQIFAKTGKKQYSAKKLNANRKISCIQAINQSHPELKTKSKINPLCQLVHQYTPSHLKLRNFESKLKKDNIRQILLIDRNNFKKDDSFPLISAKKFSIRRMDKKLRKQQMNERQFTIQRQKDSSIFEPWQINDQNGEIIKFRFNDLP